MKYIFIGAITMGLSLLGIFTLTIPEVSLGRDATTILFILFCFIAFMSLPIMFIGTIIKSK